MSRSIPVGARGMVRRVCLAALAAGLLACVCAQGASASGAPGALTTSATGVNGEATLNGDINPNGLETTYYFEYGPTASYGSKTAEVSAGSGTGIFPESATITGLEVGKEYHYQIVATNVDGTKDGKDKAFTEGSAPKFTREAMFSGESSGGVDVEVGNGNIFTCTSSTMAGESFWTYAQNKAHHITLHLKNCGTASEHCRNTAGEEIVISNLVGELGFIHRPGSGEEEDGMRLFPASGSEFAKFECALIGSPANIAVRGSVIAPIKNLGGGSLQYTFAFGSGAGKPSVTHFEGGPEYALEAESTGRLAYTWKPFAFATQLGLSGELEIEP